MTVALLALGVVLLIALTIPAVREANKRVDRIIEEELDR